jgi:nucleotide-binding universal stress UspA family protein
MKSILIPTDFSDNAKHAIDYAFRVFGSSFNFTIMHSFQTPTANASSLYSIEPLLKKEAQEMMHKLIKELTNEYGDEFQVKEQVLHGSVVDCCDWMIEHHPVDLIIMGTQGAGWLKERVLGSNTSKVIEHVKCPILCIPENAVIGHPENIVWAADTIPLKDAMRSTVEYFSTNSKIPLKVVHVQSKKQLADIEDSYTHGKFGETLSGIPHDFHTVKAEDVVEGIENYLADNQVDLLIMVKHNYSLIQSWFHRSPTLRIAMHNKVPLLALHERNI